MSNLPKPVERSPWRLKIGTLYYTARRRAAWVAHGQTYAIQRPEMATQHPFTVFEHKSLLLRQLKNVDMWLQHNKVHNLGLAIKALHGIVIRPGETFSFWRTVGRPSKRRGFVQGMVLCNGGFRADWGGGLCQLSNLMYWMTLHTPLTVVERYRHQYDVFPDSNRTLPFGSGATVSYNYIDLQIRNDTSTSYRLHVFLTEQHLRGAWLSAQPVTNKYHVYEKHHVMTQDAHGRYYRHNQIWRETMDASGQLVEDRLMTENHAIMMYSPLLPSGTS